MTGSSNQPPRVAVVTGGARGIGAGIALRLAQDGHDIAVIDLDATACAETVRDIEGLGRRAFAVGANVADEAAVQEAISNIVSALGPPTIVVNNAGILRDRTIGKMSIDDWDSVINVNLRGTFLVSRETQFHMRAAGWGRIINLSSTAALGNLGESNYAAAKAGVQGLTKTLAIELGRYGITANAVAPGFVETAMTAEVAERVGISFDEMKQQAVRATVVGRVGQPEDIANAVSFFADERSGFVTGQILYVAGAPRG
ncbi:SDR family oxidoreductase [Sphingorhabdus sp. EL138]|uniref:SDR family oxidoreductase n=1 Tax=Sphingorhabdus sp. EL138 TaxID=2073156 RepID=UPI0025E5F027|nr:SDR family oxidoreductase [Sphingorhabdus sp. EL138]